MRKSSIMITVLMLLCLAAGIASGYVYVNLKGGSKQEVKTVASSSETSSSASDKAEEGKAIEEPVKDTTKEAIPAVSEPTKEADKVEDTKEEKKDEGKNSSATAANENKQTGVDWDLSSELIGRIKNNFSISPAADSELLKAAQNIALGKTIANLTTIRKGWEVGGATYAFSLYNKGTVKVAASKLNTSALAADSAWKSYNISMPQGSGNYKYMLAKYVGNNTYEITYVSMGIAVKPLP